MCLVPCMRNDVLDADMQVDRTLGGSSRGVNVDMSYAVDVFGGVTVLCFGRGSDK